MSMKTIPPPVTARALRWAGRLASLAVIAILVLFMIGEGYNPLALKPRDLLLAVFFPLGFLLGLILGWRREFLGGVMVLAGLVGFYLVHLALNGGFPKGWAFVFLSAPGILLLLSAAMHRHLSPS
jgi:hypothetical protein